MRSIIFLSLNSVVHSVVFRLSLYLPSNVQVESNLLLDSRYW